MSAFRFAALLAALVGLAMLAMPASAQEDGCTESNPCPWAVDVDADGFIRDGGEAAWSGTLGDWFTIEVYNQDLSGADHEMAIEELDVAFTAYNSFESDEVDETGLTTYGPFQLTAVGTFTFEDLTAGDEATVTVTEGDVVDETEDDGASPTDPSDPDPSDEEHADPFPGAVALGLALVALTAVVVRRRK